MKKLVVWYNSKNDTYYYRIVKTIYYEGYAYEVGSTNSYGHVIVLVIPLNDIIKPPTLKKTIINKCVVFLKRI